MLAEDTVSPAFHSPRKLIDLAWAAPLVAWYGRNGLRASRALILIGFALSLVTLAWLGRSFSIVPEARGLATTGPYAVSRHPLYVVEQVAMVGYAMQREGALPWLLLAAELALQCVRIRFEERVLREAFREAFDDYARRTALLVPGLPDFQLLSGAPNRG